MRLAIMGAGGVGGYFGARLALAGNDVTFIARGAHGAAIRAHGLHVDSPKGDVLVRPAKVVAKAAEAEAVEAVLLAVKMNDVESAARDLKPLIHRDTSVFCFQNGIEAAGIVGDVIGAKHVVPGVAQISAVIAEPGRIKHTSAHFARLVFGETDGSVSDRVRTLHAACIKAGFEADVSTDITKQLWLKFVMLAPMAAAACLYRSAMGPIRKNAHADALLTRLVDEAIAVGRAMNVNLETADRDAVMRVFTLAPDSQKPSMLHDLESGKRLELPFLSGAVMRLAKEHGVDAPTHAFVCEALALVAEGR